MKILITTLLVGYTSCVLSASTSCPPFMEVTETAQPHDGYTLYTNGNPPEKTNSITINEPLETILFQDDSPEKMGLLAPDIASKTILTWNFRDIKKGDIWMSCAYRNTSMMFSRKVEANVTMCTVKFKKGTSSSPTLAYKTTAH